MCVSTVAATVLTSLLSLLLVVSVNSVNRFKRSFSDVIHNLADTVVFFSSICRQQLVFLDHFDDRRWLVDNLYREAIYLRVAGNNRQLAILSHRGSHRLHDVV